ncbi:MULTISPECIES: HNH endonuclease [unclassified Moraxella]|uniref:HNH endonuclease n=1 Tax=unclassified Moraxella TaxID=2685852 RepID=UPI003AF42B80
MPKAKKNKAEEDAFWDAILAEAEGEPAVPCELCGRTEVELTRHHLIPQSRHNKARTKKEFSRDEMKNEIAMLCTACHAQVHEVFSNQELSSYYHTVERLASHTDMEKFINWVKKRPAGQHIAVKSAKGNSWD